MSIATNLPGTEIRTRYWEWATAALLAALLLFVLLGYNEHGISNDEIVQRTYGELLLQFYSSGFADRRAFSYINLYYYGGLFDMLAAGLQQHLPMDVWDLRHLLTGLCGLSGMVATALLARLVTTARGAFLSVLLLCLTGAWIGTLFTHTKDIPFAAAMTWSVYAITRIVPALPRPGWRLVLGTGLAIGCALGMRVGGLFAVLYLGLAVCVGLAADIDSPRVYAQRLLAIVPRMAVLVLVAGIVMAIAWPWSVMGWTNLFDAATKFSHFSFDMATLVDGQLIQVGDVPATYLSQYLLVRLPELLLFGLLLAGVLLCVRAAQLRLTHEESAHELPLLLAATFPIMFSLLTAPALYNGVRHFTFLLPPLAVVAAMGLEATLTWLGRSRLTFGLFSLLILAGVADPAITLARLHPYEQLAYNHVTGGTRGAEDRWESDYWGDSLRAAVELLNARLRSEIGDAAGSYTVAFCAEPLQAEAYLDPRLHVTRDWPSADFFVTATHINCDKALKGDVIGSVERMGLAFAVVKDRRNLVGHERRVHK